MPSFTLTQRVEAPIDAVFDVFSDIPRCHERIEQITAIEMLTDGPVGVGTRWRETRMVFKRVATEEMEVTAFEPGRSYTVGCQSCGCEYEVVLDPVPDGAIVVLQIFETVIVGFSLQNPELRHDGHLRRGG